MTGDLTSSNMIAQESNELRKEIFDLKNQLELADISDSAVADQTIRHLDRLLAANDEAFDRGFADLKQFWLSSVDWCSELSKQIEKLIIMREDSLNTDFRASFNRHSIIRFSA